MSENTGPIYGVNLIDSLPIGGGMKQSMPSRRDLVEVSEVNQRVVAGYEVAIATIESRDIEIEALKEANPDPRSAPGIVPESMPPIKNVCLTWEAFSELNTAIEIERRRADKAESESKQRDRAVRVLNAVESCITPLPGFLGFIANRLVQHGDDENVDFVLSLRDRAERIRAAMCEQQSDTGGPGHG